MLKRQPLLPGAVLALLLTGWFFFLPPPALCQDETDAVPFYSVSPLSPGRHPVHHAPDLKFRVTRPPEMEQWICGKLVEEKEQAAISVLTAEQHPSRDSTLTWEYTTPSEPEAQRWSSFLPIWGEEAKKRGHELPLPFGISGSFFFAKRDIDVDSVDVDIKNNTLNVEEFASIKVRSKERNWSMRFDVWVLPFLNIYLLGGYTHQHSDIGIDMNKGNIVKNLRSSPDQISAREHIDKVRSRQNILPKHIDIDFDIDFYGPTYGGGATLVGGYKKLFFVVDTNYTISDLTGDLEDYNTLDEQVDALLVSARLGWRETVGKTKLNLWIGETYWGISQTIKGDVDIPLLGKVDFTVEESPEKSFSTHIGTHIEITRSFNFLCDVGTNFSDMFSVTPAFMYRF